MQVRWLVTPYFFDQHDAALAGAVGGVGTVQMNAVSGQSAVSPEWLKRVHVPVAEFAARAVRDGDLPVSIAGDCVASLPVMAGVQAAGLAPVLVWLDAHGDFNTMRTSPSGFLGGMGLAMMVGRGDLTIARNALLSPLAEEDVWLVGARDFDPLEAVALASSHLQRITISDFAALCLSRPVHLHIDNDVIDAAWVPANNYPVGDGPSLSEAQAACARFAANNAICAISFSGWNGTLDRDGRTAAACKALLGGLVQACVTRSAQGHKKSEAP